MDMDRDKIRNVDRDREIHTGALTYAGTGHAWTGKGTGT